MRLSALAVVCGLILTGAAEPSTAPTEEPLAPSPAPSPATAPADADAAAAPSSPEAARAALQAARQAQRTDRRAARDAGMRARTAERARRALVIQQVGIAAALQQAEQAYGEQAGRVDALARARATQEARLADAERQFALVLPLAERLSEYPAETMLALPVSPEDALRGVLVLRGAARDIERQAELVRAEQTRLDGLIGQLAAAEPGLSVARATAAARAAALDAAIAQAEAERQTQTNTAAASAQAAEDAARRAETLRGAIIDLEQAKREEVRRAREEARAAVRAQNADAAEAARARAAEAAPVAGPDVLAADAAPRGQLTVPVAGKITVNWGMATEAGPATGLSYATPPEARVVSPCAGRVVFAAPFRGYGPMFIVDCGGGWFAVLAGLARLDAAAGADVIAGQPLGVMPAWDPAKPAGRRPGLYVELRRGGAPVDPVPWLRASG